MNNLIGTSFGVFVGLGGILFGGAALKTGQALAVHWRPAWQIVPYCLLLAVGDRFLAFALFGDPLLSASGYAAIAALLLALCGAAYRATRASCMVAQYPWIYERQGVFGWRERA